MFFDDDDDDDDEGACGFTASDCHELAMQGIKPWDEEAGAALAMLNGYGGNGAYDDEDYGYGGDGARSMERT